MSVADDTAGHRFETRAIHAGQEPEPTYGSVNVPVFQTSTYRQSEVGVDLGYDYARTGNPTRTALEVAMAAAEGTPRAVAFASGMAGEDAILRLLDPGEHVVLGDDVYGGTYRLIARVLSRAGLEFTPVDLSDLDAVATALRPSTRIVWTETPSNPLLKIIDLAALAELAHSRGAWLVADNTFATPYLQQPASLGADIVTSSTTKYVGGHSDVVGGVVCTTEELAADLAFLQNGAGAVPGPWDCYLTLRGLKTLAVRMDRHCANAQALAEWLQGRPEVSWVSYPGLDSHPGHQLARRQMRAFGGMISIRLAGGVDAAKRVAAACELFFLAESLGGVESLIEHPGAMTHASVSGTQLEVPDDLLRLSVGIEHVDDLRADLEQALGAV